MKKGLSIALACGVLLTATQAMAQRPSTRSMTCAAARDLVMSRGAVVLSTGPDLYDRYVSTDSACSVGQYARPSFAPTLDNPTCALGAVCVTRPENDR